MLFRSYIIGYLVSNITISSNDPNYLYLSGYISSPSYGAQGLVMKLPIDGSGDGIYPVSGFTNVAYSGGFSASDDGITVSTSNVPTFGSTSVSLSTSAQTYTSSTFNATTIQI